MRVILKEDYVKVIDGGKYISECWIALSLPVLSRLNPVFLNLYS